MAGFELDPTYKDVPQRMADFKAIHPDGCLRPADLAQPYRIECVNGAYFVVYVAAAYRSPDDLLPGIGTAWEPFPGRTPYTKDSELQNAETSAWGRAIVAALRSESKAVASAEDVRNRQAEAAASQEEVDELRDAVTDAIADLTDKQWTQVTARFAKENLPKAERMTVDQANAVLAFVASLTDQNTNSKGAGDDGPDRGGDAGAKGSDSGETGDGGDGQDVARTVPEPAPAHQGEEAGSALHGPASDPTPLTGFKDTAEHIANKAAKGAS